MINGHVDVAEIDKNELQDSNPFQPMIKEGHLIGRGAAEMKVGLGTSLFAIKLLKEVGIELSVT